MILNIGTRVSGEINGQKFVGTVTNTGEREGHTTSAGIATENTVVTPSGRTLNRVIVVGRNEVEALQAL